MKRKIIPTCYQLGYTKNYKQLQVVQMKLCTLVSVAGPGPLLIKLSCGLHRSDDNSLDLQRAEVPLCLLCLQWGETNPHPVSHVITFLWANGKTYRESNEGSGFLANFNLSCLERALVHLAVFFLSRLCSSLQGHAVLVKITSSGIFLYTFLHCR